MVLFCCLLNTPVNLCNCDLIWCSTLACFSYEMDSVERVVRETEALKAEVDKLQVASCDREPDSARLLQFQTRFGRLIERYLDLTADDQTLSDVVRRQLVLCKIRMLQHVANTPA